MQTFTKIFEIHGVGIHSGSAVKMTVKPSKKYGIFFRRIDVKNSKPISATYDNFSNASRQNTTIGGEKDSVQTIEHIMAALFLVGVDSVIIELDGPETPILDGSAEKFIKIFQKYLNKSTNNMRKIVVKKTITVHRREIIKKMPLLSRLKFWLYNLKSGRKENGFVRLSPDSTGLSIIATLDYPDKIIGIQSYKFLFDGSEKSKKKFITEIANARTFGRISEWEYLKKHGMGHGADSTNVIALNNNGDGTLNELYSPDEFVRHKIIDLIGDMYTSGGQIIGRIESYKGSHALNNMVLKKLFDDPQNYDIIV